MKGYEPHMSFGEDVAGIYREARRGDEADAVALLEQLAGNGPALELWLTNCGRNRVETGFP